MDVDVTPLPSETEEKRSNSRMFSVTAQMRNANLE